MFASKTDIQAWLRSDRIIIDDANSQKPNIEAKRIIVGRLAGFFSQLVITSWADPDTTPELIRGIAGRLAAAFLYQSYYSEESTDVLAYAQWLYNNAVLMLDQIIAGDLIVVEIDNSGPIDVTGSDLLGFMPSDPVFTMGQEFA